MVVEIMGSKGSLAGLRQWWQPYFWQRRKMGCLYSVFDVKKQGKPVWVVRARNWKLRGGENRLSGLLEGVSVSGNVFK
ncbi:hypothetical protein GQ457_12G030070 [Hibiscus cannabinus]